MTRAKTCRRGHDQTVHGYTRPKAGYNMCLACIYQRRRERRAEFNATMREWKRKSKEARK